MLGSPLWLFVSKRRTVLAPVPGCVCHPASKRVQPVPAQPRHGSLQLTDRLMDGDQMPCDCIGHGAFGPAVARSIRCHSMEETKCTLPLSIGAGETARPFKPAQKRESWQRRRVARGRQSARQLRQVLPSVNRPPGRVVRVTSLGRAPCHGGGGTLRPLPPLRRLNVQPPGCRLARITALAAFGSRGDVSCFPCAASCGPAHASQRGFLEGCDRCRISVKRRVGFGNPPH